MELLFSYGTLRLEQVQLGTFGRRLVGSADVLSGFELSPLRIEDEHVIEISGKAMHTIATFTGNQSDRIAGISYSVTDEELEKADSYEVTPCLRISVVLESGRRAWVYVDRRYQPEHP